MLLKDKVLLVTGGGSGMGEGAARMLIENGGFAAVLDLPTSRGKQLEEEFGDRLAFFPTDVTQEAQVASAFAAVEERFERIDVCVNAAGIADAARVLSRDGEMFPMSTYTRVVSVNLIGTFDVVRNAARVMSRNEPGQDGERGVIINVASIAGIEGQAGQAAYSASKGGVIAMTLPLARDLASIGIRVNTLCPGIFDTGMLAAADEKLRQRLADIHVFPKRLGTPADFAHFVRAIVENPMVNGEVIRIDAATRLAHG